jgi:PIN domain nuclease of toxin-antitoxin system
MRLLLDTHIFCWSFYEDERLSKQAIRAMQEAEEIFISSVSLWEVAIKVRIGKMDANPQQLFEQIEANGFQELPVFCRHTLRVADLPLHHADPFDRLLVAQALSESLHLLTANARLKAYSDLVVCF